MLEYALQYASRGWPILPVVPGAKNPLTTHGCKDATTDPDIIRGWWAKWPSANIGIATGSKSGADVVDIDPRHGGDVSFEELCPASKRPDTIVCSTASGGHHYWFKCCGVRNKTNIVPGVDVRGEGGYVLVPPSVLDNGGSYVWESGPEESTLADVPEWLSPLLLNGKGDTIGILSPAIGAPGEPIGDGSRNATLSQIAGSLRRYGATEDSILRVLRVENERCKPPLSDSEVETIARSIARYTPESDTASLTDTGNANRLVSLFGENIRYVHDWGKWIMWDGVRWQPDETDEIQVRAESVIRSMYEAANKTEDLNRRAALAKHAVTSESLSRRRAMVELARSMVPALIRDLDNDPFQLGVRNGVIDLRTGELREGRREDLITKQADVTYDPDAEAPTWTAFLRDTFNGDDSLIKFVQKAIGYSLTGSTREQVVFICHGSGENGKSTLINTIGSILNDYHVATPPSTIALSKSYGIPNDLARLRGIRYTSLLEFQEGRRIDEPLLKAMSGGDTIAARFLHAEYFDLHMQAKLFLGTNHKPVFRGTDHGLWRRIRMIPFTVKVPDEKRDSELGKKLLAESSGILNWALHGLACWLDEGLDQPAAVLMATSDFRTESDVLGDFLDEFVEKAPGWECPSSYLYDAYRKWCEDSGERAESQRWLTIRLEERGYSRKRTKSGRVWVGIAVRDAAMKEGRVTLK